MKKLLVYGFALLLILSLVTASIPKYEKISLSNGMCLFKPINQKVIRQDQPIKAEDANKGWRYNPMFCNTYSVTNENLRDDFLDGDIVRECVNGICDDGLQIVGGLDGTNYLSNQNYKDQHNNAFTTVVRHPIKEYKCGWTYVGDNRIVN